MKIRSEKQKLLDKGYFGTYHTPLALKIGIEDALILNRLVDKYDYWVRDRGEFNSTRNFCCIRMDG